VPQGTLHAALQGQLIEHEQDAEDGAAEALADHLYRACQGLADQPDDVCGQFREIGQGALFDLSTLPIRRAQQNRGRRLASAPRTSAIS